MPDERILAACSANLARWSCGMTAASQRALQLVVAQQGLIQAYARAICRNPNLADDVAQEVSLAVVEAGERLPPVEREIAWLKGVVRHKAIDALRRRRVDQPLDEATLVDIGERLGPASDNGLRAMTEAMSTCLQRLSADARSMVAARYAQGEACERIAQRLGRSVQAVYGVLKRSRLALEDCVRRRLGSKEQSK
ncbi:MAG: sigma-70 family RNA polymerase sigma factor [Planctomycetota bacterium]|nr:MAG: sigma-70 family RNA polymerase sigma factor [Planctomycetota bacterium]